MALNPEVTPERRSNLCQGQQSPYETTLKFTRSIGFFQSSKHARYSEKIDVITILTKIT